MATESDGLVFTACDIGQVGRGTSILSLAKTAGVYIYITSVGASRGGWNDLGVIGHDGRRVYIKESIRYYCPALRRSD